MTAKPKSVSARARDLQIEHLQFQVYGLAAIVVLLGLIVLYPIVAAGIS